MRILLVEDDATLAGSVASYLRGAGFAVDAVESVAAAMREVRLNPYDAIVLDVNLPDGTGFDLCRALRKAGNGARIVMATARDDVDDRVLGLNLGADDYVVKPYVLAELVARLHAVLRRPDDGGNPVLRVEDLELNTATRTAYRGERVIPLTAKEFAVLHFLVLHAGRVVTREQISEHAWDANYDPLSNVVDVYVARLRRKLEDEGEEPVLHTMRGAGYRLGRPARGAR